MSLNARGIRTFEKRKALFQWLNKDKADIIFLQETYSTPDVENIWKSQWKGDLYFAHGSEHSRGVLILIKEKLSFELKSYTHDNEGRFIILKANVQEQSFIFVNIYAPNKASEQSIFFQEIQTALDSLNIEAECDIIIGGDFNVILNPELDGLGGKSKLKESVKIINQIRSSFDLIDIWRVRNPDVKRFSWRQKNPVIQRRLDFWLISSSTQNDIDKSVDIIPAIKSDHSAITLSINGIEEQHHGPSFWKFNASLIDDGNFVSLIRDKYCTWIEEGKKFDDPRVLWDYIKYKIRQETIAYSKCKARERRATLLSLEKQIQECQLACDKDPSSKNLNELEILQTDYDRQYEFIAQGAIIRSRANWYEYGEKSNKYFLNLENCRKKKSCIRKLTTENDKTTSNPKEILNEIQSFYENLYNKKVDHSDENLMETFLSKVDNNT